jgi:hypothetical protein
MARIPVTWYLALLFHSHTESYCRITPLDPLGKTLFEIILFYLKSFEIPHEERVVGRRVYPTGPYGSTARIDYPSLVTRYSSLRPFITSSLRPFTTGGGSCGKASPERSDGVYGPVSGSSWE